MKAQTQLRTLIVLFLSLIFSALSFANERHYSYVYESTVMGKGAKELEIWTTPKLGKDMGYYARMENRIEFEVGLSNRLLTAFYLNTRQTTADNNTGVNTTEFEFEGISSEWKYQISKPTGALGFALYAELGLNTDEVELETKLIFDKKFGKTFMALNFTFEPEWELTPGKSEQETKLETSFGLSHEFTPHFSAGIEARQHNVFAEGELEHSALFAGPVVSVSQPSWWATLTVMPQITAFKNKTPGKNLDLSEYTKLEARLIFSLELGEAD